jgi:signal transduction histidine kinase
MKYSIRTHLTFLIVVIFLFIFLFIFLSGGIALYLSLNHAVDKNLEVEEQRLAELLISEFHDLLTGESEQQESLREEFIEELNEICKYKHQFVMISLESNNGRHVYTGGERDHIQSLLAGGFLSHKNGFYSQEFDGNLYRILISEKDWGRLIIGIENQTFFEVANEFREILLVGIPILIVLIFIGGNFLARWVMRPVVSAAEKADKITLTNLVNDLSDYDKKDEFGILVNTLNSMIARLDQGVQRIQQFTQDAAHELRTPITILRGELELLYQEKDLSGENRAALQKALDKTILLHKIVDDLMLLAQSDSDSYQLNPTIFQLDQIVKDTIEDLKILSENRPVEVSINHCDSVSFTGDEPLIRRLLLNLSDNALKYTEKGQIGFSLRHQNGGVEIKISDTGIGISEQDLPHIFNRFYRANKNKTGLKRGSGLGLSISKWIVDAHGGKIDIESTPSSGTTVVIRFPRQNS